VYLGRDPSTNARVVIRTFRLSHQWREFGDLSELLNSFQKLCEMTLDHPSLARPLAFGAEGKIPYLVYSHLAGTAMDVVMRQHGARPLAEVLRRTRQLAVAIDCAAGEGILHGMMTPRDVILDGEQSGITGFGLAQTLIKVAVPAEAEFPYGSPQRLAGAPPTRADDVFSLAAITLELLIGTPKDPDHESREAQGLPERRRMPRPAPHETRVFTRIAGVDAGKLRACFAAAFSEEPSGRPSTATDFVASFEDAFSNKRDTDDTAPSAITDEFISEERDVPRPAAALDKKRSEDDAPLEVPLPQALVVAEKRETRAMVRPAAIEDTFIAEVASPLRASSIDDASYRIPVHSGLRGVFVAMVVAASFAAGFGGGLIVGQRSRPSPEPMNVGHHEPVAAPQPTRAAAEDPKPIASTPPAVAPTSKVAASTPKEKEVAPIPNEKASKSQPTAAPVTQQRAVAAIESGRVLVRSTPAGASVLVDGQSRGVTPIAVGELAFGAHRIEVSQEGQPTRWLWVTLTERRPTQSVDFDFRPTSAPPHDGAEANATAPTRSARSEQVGSLHVASHPSGAQVFVDDNLIGTTPLLLSNVAAGSKRLRLELSGYKSWTTSVQVEPGARRPVSASLEP